MATVELAAGITREAAERAVVATLRTLAERITRGEAEDIALFLRELRTALTSAPEPTEAFDRDDFIRRVAEREGVDEDRGGARACRARGTRLRSAARPRCLTPKLRRGLVAERVEELADARPYAASVSATCGPQASSASSSQEAFCSSSW